MNFSVATFACMQSYNTRGARRLVSCLSTHPFLAVMYLGQHSGHHALQLVAVKARFEHRSMASNFEHVVKHTKSPQTGLGLYVVHQRLHHHRVAQVDCKRAGCCREALNAGLGRRGRLTRHRFQRSHIMQKGLERGCHG